MYVRLHARKCKKPSNELRHALSEPFTAWPIKHPPQPVHRAAALATGCQVSIVYSWGATFDLRQNRALGTPHTIFRMSWKFKTDIQVVKLRTSFLISMVQSIMNGVSRVHLPILFVTCYTLSKSINSFFVKKGNITYGLLFSFLHETSGTNIYHQLFLLFILDLVRLFFLFPSLDIP